MRATDDTYVPGYLIEKAVQVVGARRAAAFRVHDGPGGVQTLELFRCFPSDVADGVSNRELADALRRFVIPSLAEGRDVVMEMPERQGPIFRTFVLVFLVRDASGVRGVTAMEVTCASRYEAERRLAALTQIMS
jgi:hypothetical protein